MWVSTSMVGCTREWPSNWRSCLSLISLCSLKVSGMSPLLHSCTYITHSTEPLLPTQPEEIADLSRTISTPIALGERLYTRSDFRPYLEQRAIDIAQPDVRIFSFLFTAIVAQYSMYVGVPLRWYQRAAPHCLPHRDV